VEEIDIDRLTVTELVMLLDRSLDPDLPVPLLESARPGPPKAVSAPKPDARSLN
jgi:hypothetical protein